MNIVIIGANRGIGLALVKEYINKGEHVWAVCRNMSTELQHLENGKDSLTVLSNIDVTIDGSRNKLLSSLPTQINHFVHNAGILERNTITNIDAQSITRQFLVNSLAPLQTITTCLDKLHRGSKIGIITSRMGSLTDNTSAIDGVYTVDAHFSMTVIK